MGASNWQANAGKPLLTMPLAHILRALKKSWTVFKTQHLAASRPILDEAQFHPKTKTTTSKFWLWGYILNSPSPNCSPNFGASHDVFLLPKWNLMNPLRWNLGRQETSGIFRCSPQIILFTVCLPQFSPFASLPPTPPSTLPMRMCKLIKESQIRHEAIHKEHNCVLMSGFALLTPSFMLTHRESQTKRS